MPVKRLQTVAMMMWPLLALALMMLAGCHPPGHH